MFAELPFSVNEADRPRSYLPTDLAAPEGAGETRSLSHERFSLSSLPFLEPAQFFLRSTLSAEPALNHATCSSLRL